MQAVKQNILFLLLCSSLIFSQVQNPQWRNYTNSGTVHSIAEEGDYVWLGTDGGLVKLNKLTLEKTFFNKGNSYLPSNIVNSITIDSLGYKWLATARGLVKFKDDSWVIYKTGNSGLPENKLTCITLDKAGNKWIGTNDSGLVMFDDVNWTIYNHQNSLLTSDKIRALKTDNEFLWVGTYDGLYKREINDFTFITAIGNRHINCLEKDVIGNTWVGTSTGLFKLTGIGTIAQFSAEIITSLGVDIHNVKWFGTGVHYTYYASMWNIDSTDTQVTPNTLVNSATEFPWFFSMLLEPTGKGWFGSANGLIKADESAEFINVSNSALGRIYASKLFLDKNNVNWFYAWGSIPLSEPVLPPGYLASITDSTWTAFNLSNSPVDIGGVIAVSDFNGTDMFVAVYGVIGNTELYRYSSGSWTQITVPLTQYDLILYMWFDEVTGNLWVDFEGANGENNIFITSDGYNWTPVPDYPVYDINKMKRINNIIWIASPEGLIKYDGIIFTLYTTSNSGLPNNNVTSLDFDSEGNVWVGTVGGLAEFDGTNWTVYNRYNSPLSCDRITGLAIDSSDNIFLGTQTIDFQIPALGLVKYDGTNWTFYTSDNSGKPDVSYSWEGEDINDLSIDVADRIWIVTDGGVGVFDKDGVPVPVEFTSFSASVKGSDVVLAWTTATERNNRGFEVERRVNRRQKSISSQWEKIGFVAGNGTTTEPRSYSFTDENVTSGIYKYRLKQIDFDGSFEYSKEIEVEVNASLQFSLSQNYPNPFNPITTIKYQLPVKGFVSLKIYNSLGQEIETLVNEEKPTGSFQVKFDGTRFPSGVYFYRIETDKFSNTKKFILLK